MLKVLGLEQARAMKRYAGYNQHVAAVKQQYFRKDFFIRRGDFFRTGFRI